MSENKILVVAADEATREAPCAALDAAGFEPVPAASVDSACDLVASMPVSLALVHGACPGDWRQLRRHAGAPPVVVMEAGAEVPRAVQAIRSGAVDFLTNPEDASAVVSVTRRHAVVMNSRGVIAVDERTRGVLDLARRVAPKPVTVLLNGESGTGKEVFARYLHEQSDRARGPFVAVNCAAIPENMLEALLFGYEKGAFTGATRSHPGKFEQAAGGTLLLDEISEIAPELQAKLLRALQEREVERLCGTAPIPVDARVVATTNRDLRQAVQNGQFREDLYYRLHVFPIQLPPLRERRDDILPLADAFLRKFGDGGATMSPGARHMLREYEWPGNVRELENVVQRALILADDGCVDAEDLRFELGPLSSAAPEADASLDDSMKDSEHRLILDTLRQSNGSRKMTAERLGISVRTLRYKLARMRDDGVPVPDSSAMAQVG
ncbi:sigma-54-dependent transcriptional regulator [Aquisalimonas asiatica]|uniref:Two component, sigma54 specific, transcriptional regulator, Fis family n=1 Tax=Aquisalimonas asiatica TaxID=406100 RepID=A0A1H8QT36_9GAMM|nr:sigma-54 dependent transcriptional regulator [Aquisalimonas asiatica]SEO57380.1 two component, sigma54 specific, transcriptional regulator, Fis family [Aquisalimonas asiatica]